MEALCVVSDLIQVTKNAYKIKINKKEKKEIIPIRDVILTVSAKWIS